MDSKTQPQLQLTCSIHNQPACAIKCTDLGEGSTIKCILCIMKEKLQTKDLITLLEIFNPEVEQSSSVLLPLTDEQLKTLIKIKNDNPDRLIAIISDFFSTLKEEAIKKINEQEKTAIDQANDLIEAQKKLNEKYLEFTSRKDLNNIISTNQNNQDILNERLKKYFKESNQTQMKKLQEIQQLITNYENMTFTEDISTIFKRKILNNISQISFFKIPSEEEYEQDQKKERLSAQQIEFLQILANSTERLSQVLSRTASLFQSNEPLDSSFVHALIEENQDQNSQQNPKALLRQTQSKLFTIYNSNKSVKEILQILKPLSISQRLDALSAIVQNLPVADILGKIIFKAEVSKCQFMNSQYPQSNPMYSQLPFSNDSNAPLLKILNQGFSSLYSDCILDPKLKYQLDITFNNEKNTNDLCYVGLLPDNQKDQILMSELNLAFSNQTNQQPQQSQPSQQVSQFGAQPLDTGLLSGGQKQSKQLKSASFSSSFFICISEQIFIVLDEKGDIIYTIPKTSIQNTTQYRIGIQFQSNNNSNRQFAQQSQMGYAIKQSNQSQTYYQNLTVQSFQVLNEFPSFCI